jgi:carbon storage regulator
MEGAMLVLTRKLGESITIDDRITITFIALKGNQVKLGIDAPAETKIYRQEIYARIMEANKQAATSRQQNLSAMRALWPCTPQTGTGSV